MSDLRALAVAGAVAMALTVPASAAPIYDTTAALTGTRAMSAGDGITKGGGNVTAASLSWLITSVAGGWHYKYSFTENSQQSISHFILDLSDNCTVNSGCVEHAAV